MEQQVIEVQKRQENGKGAAHRVRAGGRIPGVLYGHKQEPVSFTCDPHELRKKVKASGMGRNTVFKVQGLGRDILALLKEAQIDPVKRSVIHIDLVEVRETDRVVVEVPVELTGKPAGVVTGGILQAVSRTITLEVTPTNIPNKIVVDVSHLELGQAIHVAEVKLPEGTKSVGGNFTIATVQAPRAEVEEKPAAAEGVAVEGAEGAAAPAAEGAEGEKKAAAPKAAEAAAKPEKGKK